MRILIPVYCCINDWFKFKYDEFPFPLILEHVSDEEIIALKSKLKSIFEIGTELCSSR